MNAETTNDECSDDSLPLGVNPGTEIEQLKHYPDGKKYPERWKDSKGSKYTSLNR